MANVLRRLTAWIVGFIYTLGGDVSHWQGAWNATVAFAAGWKFVFIRAGSINNVTGELYEDFRFRENADQAFVVFEWFGFYWYFRPNHDPVAQAKYFANLIRNTGFTLLPVVDVEDSGGKTPEQVRTALKTFIVVLFIELGIDRLIIYTRQSFWDARVAPDPLFSSMPLFAARYHTGLTSPWSDGFFKFRDWVVWAFWQFWADGNFQGSKYGCESPHVDLDYVNGDIQQYAIEEFDMDELLARVEALELAFAELQTQAAERDKVIGNIRKSLTAVGERVKSLEDIPAAARVLLEKLLGAGG